jgi:hypothetical protein
VVPSWVFRNETLPAVVTGRVVSTATVGPCAAAHGALEAARETVVGTSKMTQQVPVGFEKAANTRPVLSVDTATEMWF